MPDLPGRMTRDGSSERRLPQGLTIGLVILVILLFGFSSAGDAIASPAILPISSNDSLASPGAVASSGDSADHTAPTKCAGYSSVAAYDPADGYVYALGGTTITIVASPCNVVKTIYLGNADYHQAQGVTYDPLTKEIVVTDIYAAVVYVLQGTSIVKTVSAPIGNGGGNLAWDGAIGSLLIPDESGVTVLHLDVVNGKTRASVVLDEFDRSNGNCPVAELVADGYIFSAGNNVHVFNDRTFAYVGAFHFPRIEPPCVSNYLETLAWDPLNNTVVMGGGYYSVAFLDANSVASHKFTFGHLSYHGLLHDGVDDVAYSPATKEIYMTANLGADVLRLSNAGELTHVFLGNHAADSLGGLAYDPLDRDMYICVWGWPGLYVIP